jgi:lactoylglutathione lyase
MQNDDSPARQCGQNSAVVTLELASRPADGPVRLGTGFNRLVVQVDDLADTISRLERSALQLGRAEQPAGPDRPLTAWLTGPGGTGSA